MTACVWMSKPHNTPSGSKVEPHDQVTMARGPQHPLGLEVGVVLQDAAEPGVIVDGVVEIRAAEEDVAGRKRLHRVLEHVAVVEYTCAVEVGYRLHVARHWHLLWHLLRGAHSANP
jgi:hypothetical protein